MRLYIRNGSCPRVSAPANVAVLRLVTLPKKIVAAALAAALIFLLCPQSARAQAIVDQALDAFPPDTQQVAYINFGELRSTPDYRQIESAVLNRQALYFENFLRSVGVNPDRDVDEVLAGWRGDPSHNSSIFGLVVGQFDAAAVQNFITREHLAERSYGGYTLNAAGPGVSSADLFFTFLTPDLAAFGHRSDLEYLIDGYQGSRPALRSKAEFAGWVGELEGSAPQWGITTGKAALALLAPWLPDQQKPEAAKLLAPVRAVLYSAHWQAGFSTGISVVCDSSSDAQNLARLLALVKDAAGAGGPRSAPAAALLQSFSINTSGARVQIEGSGPLDAFAQAIRNSRAP